MPQRRRQLPTSARWVRSLGLLLLLVSCRAPEPQSSPCPPDMAFVSGGAYFSGASPLETDVAPMGERLGFVPRQPAFLEVASFCMDRYEYPNRAGEKPLNLVTFLDAERLCAARGRRLCTEQEFERACGGLDGWAHPYADTYQPGRCNAEVEVMVGEPQWLATSGAFADCVTPEGIFDLDGNLSEWVIEGLGPEFATPPPPPDLPTEHLLLDEAATIRGGTMWVAIYGTGCHARHFHPRFGPTSNDDGFRCCLDEPSSTPLPQQKAEAP